jgi:hypothetical protein
LTQKTKYTYFIKKFIVSGKHPWQGIRLKSSHNPYNLGIPMTRILAANLLLFILRIGTVTRLGLDSWVEQ